MSKNTTPPSGVTNPGAVPAPPLVSASEAADLPAALASDAEDASPLEPLVSPALATAVAASAQAEAKSHAAAPTDPHAAPSARKPRPAPLSLRERLVPVIVASPLFLQNLDTSVMATALPSIAKSLNVQPLHLNLAITSYLLSLAVFLPVSGWLAERFGAKRVFCSAIAFFSIGSALCGVANSLESLVVFRIIQGFGGAMMVPVGRLILLRSVPAAQMVAAMVWFTVPPTIGRMAGPLFGGAIVTWTSWRWIFLINVPFGLLGIAMAAWFVKELPRDADRPSPPFDTEGFVLLAVALTGVLGALELAGKSIVATWITVLAGLIGASAMTIYYLRSRNKPEPIIDLRILKYPAFRASVIGGLPLRIAIGASPFLLPLMLQLGFGLSALSSGTLTVATALGALTTRFIMSRVIRRVRFRNILLGATVMTSLCYMSYGFFTPQTPRPLMFITLMLGGLINSMGMVSLTTLGFSSVPQARMSHATALSTMGQQLSLSFGVVMGASLVALTAWWHGGDSAHLQANDFSPAFFAVGTLTMVSLLSFVRLDKNEGADLR